MKLDSVRECKSNLFKAMLAPQVITSLNMGWVALGVTKKGKENILAVRANEASMFGLVAELINKLVKSEVDFKVVGEVFALDQLDKPASDWQRGKCRPLRIGNSIAHKSVTAGSQAAIVKRNGKVLALSNNHVLACSDEAAKGDKCYQPGPADGGSETDAVATLTDWVKLKSRHNLVDAAIAELMPNIEYDPSEIPEIGKLGKGCLSIPEVEIGMILTKFGRTTSKTRCKVSASELDNLSVNYGRKGVLVFDKQVELENVESGQPGSLGGDSGSLFVQEGPNVPAALLFAGGRNMTYAGYMSEVVKALKFEIVC
jgi:hypothetical protein